MTAVREDGQVYFTFEEIDFEGAAQELSKICFVLADRLAFADKNGYARSAVQLESEYWKYVKILSYVDRLKVGQRYA